MPHNTNQNTRQQQLVCTGLITKSARKFTYVKRVDRSNLELENTKTTANILHNWNAISYGSSIADHTTTQKHAIDFDSACVIYPGRF